MQLHQQKDRNPLNSYQQSFEILKKSQPKPQTFWHALIPKPIQMLIIFVIVTITLSFVSWINYSYNSYQCKFTPQMATTVAYIWMGQSSVPAQYRQMVLKPDSQLIGRQQYQLYVEQWNSQEQMKIIIRNYNPIQQVDMFKLLHLYFRAGIYSNFDTKIDRKCLESVDYPDDEIIWASRMKYQNLTHVPQENFMMAKTPKNPMIKRMLMAELKKADRWQECKKRSCFIVNCSKQQYDNSIQRSKD